MTRTLNLFDLGMVLVVSIALGLSLGTALGDPASALGYQLLLVLAGVLYVVRAFAARPADDPTATPAGGEG